MDAENGAMVVAGNHGGQIDIEGNAELVIDQMLVMGGQQDVN